jgi:transposase
MPTPTILPDPTQVHLLGYTTTSTSITASVVATADQAYCPLCGHPSRRVYSRYVRQVSDLPWHGVALRLELHVHRFFCDQLDCPRQIFIQRLPGIVQPCARRMERLQAWFTAVGYAAGGEAGARLLRALGLAGSPDTLLRTLRHALAPARATPRVLSVDDWGIRRGQRYGTILVDLERHCPVDLLPDRSAEMFARWLQEHPGVEIISRDRGVPMPREPATARPRRSRWPTAGHLLKNLGDALEQFLRRERVQVPLPPCPRGVGDPDQDADADSVRADLTPAEDPADPASEAALSGQPTPPETKPAATAAPSRRQERFTLVHTRRQAGASVRAIAQESGMARNTVRRYLRADHCPTDSCMKG